MYTMSKANLLGHSRTKLSVSGGDHRIAVWQPVFRTILLRRHLVIAHDVLLQRLERPAASKADEMVCKDRLPHLHSGFGLGCLGGTFPNRCERSMDFLDQRRHLIGLQRVVADEYRYDSSRQAQDGLVHCCGLPNASLRGRSPSGMDLSIRCHKPDGLSGKTGGTELAG